MNCAKVAVSKANYSFDAEFSYAVPEEYSSRLLPGMRVTVPFGAGNRKSLGVVTEISDEEPGIRLKQISEVLDETPLLSGEMIALARYMSERYFCTVYDAAKAMLPTGINHRIIKSYAANPDAPAGKAESLEGAEKEFYLFLLEKGVFVKSDVIFRGLAMHPDSALPEKLLRKNLIIEQADAVSNMEDLSTRMVRLAETEEEIKLTPKQKEVLSVLQDVGAATVKELCYFTGYTPAVVEALVKKGTAEYFDCPVDYFGFTENREENRTPINLTDEQQQAADKLEKLAFSGKKATALLYGVTGSGKTSVYMSVMDKVIDSGKSVLLLVPEIGLTPQALSIFCNRYGSNVAVFHSALSVRERREQWKRVKEKKARIVIGTRSAIFAPFEDIGLIIIDEEQEHTYKSEQTPRYDAAEVAKFRSSYNNCLLLLASATPKVESYAAALKGRYELCTLTKRYGNADMPQVVTVDMRTAEVMPGCSEISRELYEQVKAVIDGGKQCILLINRRGYNTFAVCDACSNVISCPHCSISMTYHSANRRLMCHYCGYSVPFTDECPECHEHTVRYAGFGTQKIEDEIRQLFPEAGVVRMDADTTTAKDSHEKILGAFEKGEYNILLGTQMVAKGLDFPNVTLVGVISIDRRLYDDDFRSLEKTFSLLTQVVGRSGRGESKGIAVIQTLTPENEIIQIAARQDYDSFFKNEIVIRKSLIYPPYCDLCVLGITGENEITVRSSASEIIELLRQKTGGEYKDEKIIVLGPVPARISRIGGKFRYRIIIKCVNSRSFRKMISEILREIDKDKRFRAVSVYADINPDTML